MAEQYFGKGEQPAIITNYFERALGYTFPRMLIKADDGTNNTVIHDSETEISDSVRLSDTQLMTNIFSTIPRKLSQILLPAGTEKVIFEIQGLDSDATKRIPMRYTQSINAVALLGHNFYSAGADNIRVRMWFRQYVLSDTTTVTPNAPYRDLNLDNSSTLVLANATNGTSSNHFQTNEDGFSILVDTNAANTNSDDDIPLDATGQYIASDGSVWTEPYLDRLQIILNTSTAVDLLGPLRIGSIIVGSYYELPSPNLELTTSYENNLLEKTTGVSGVEFSESSFKNKSWQFKQGDPVLNFFHDDFYKTDGIKRYNLEFSSVMNKDLFPGMNISDARVKTKSDYYKTFPLKESEGDYAGEYMVNSLADSGHGSTDDYSGGALTTSFFKEVILNTGTSALPFIYINNVNSVGHDTAGNSFAGDVLWDQFDICVMDDNAFELEHVAHNLWDLSLEFYSVY